METNGNCDKKEKWFEGRILFMISVGSVLVAIIYAVVLPIFRVEGKIEQLSQQISSLKEDLEKHESWTSKRTKEVDDIFAGIKDRVSYIEYFLKFK
jgi:hypothetical protein